MDTASGPWSGGHQFDAHQRSHSGTGLTTQLPTCIKSERPWHRTMEHVNADPNSPKVGSSSQPRVVSTPLKQSLCPSYTLNVCILCEQGLRPEYRGKAKATMFRCTIQQGDQSTTDVGANTDARFTKVKYEFSRITVDTSDRSLRNICLCNLSKFVSRSHWR